MDSLGHDAYILKTGTITTVEDSHNIADMKYSVSPVVDFSSEGQQLCESLMVPWLLWTASSEAMPFHNTA